MQVKLCDEAIYISGRYTGQCTFGSASFLLVVSLSCLATLISDILQADYKGHESPKSTHITLICCTSVTCSYMLVTIEVPTLILSEVHMVRLIY